MLFLIPTGLLVLLYDNASYYARRGGRSGNGVVCGSFYVVALSTAFNIDWDAGAALSFSNHMKTIK